MLLEKRNYYKPFEYYWAFDAFKKQHEMHWLPTEVTLEEDVFDWNKKLTDSEKNLLTQLFRFFTQSDIDVANGYIAKFMPLFAVNKPELAMMMTSFAGMEGIHIWAYSHLIDTLDMPEAEYKAFQSFNEMTEKHEYLDTHSIDLNDPIKTATTLATYAAFTEGLQLFSSFAILLNFPRQGKMKGMGQIIAWSVKDESLHVESMIKLYKQYLEDNNIRPSTLQSRIEQICLDVVHLEDNFIDLAFEQGGIEGLTKEEVKNYIRYIADRRMQQLGCKPIFGISPNPLPWVEYMLHNRQHANFFESDVVEYSKGAGIGWEDDEY